MTGKDKKMNLPITKCIKINEVQEANWNPKKIREFLDSNENILKIIIKKFTEIFIEYDNIKFEFTPDEQEIINKNYFGDR